MITTVGITIPHWRTEHAALRAIASVALDDAWRINDFRVVIHKGQDGRQRTIVSAPARPRLVRCCSCRRSRFLSFNYCPYCGVFEKFPAQPGEKRFVDIAHPAKPAARSEVEGVILTALALEEAVLQEQGAAYHYAVAKYTVRGWENDTPLLHFTELRHLHHRGESPDVDPEPAGPD